MEDIFVNMLAEERERLGVSAKVLCDGICSEDMYYKVENGKSTLDRISVKRLLARLGVDNANYDHYLEYSDYMVWKNRMDIINSIEDGEYEKATEMLQSYRNYISKIKNKSRINIEEQFYAFMSLQILRYYNRKEYEVSAKSLYEEALKATVPYFNNKKLNRLMLSPMEINLVIDYINTACINDSVDLVWEKYVECLDYIENSIFSKLSQIKVYPKAVVYMYRAVMERLCSLDADSAGVYYHKLFEYIDKAFNYLRIRKSFLYIIEILEIRVELSSILEQISIDTTDVKCWTENKNESRLYITAIKNIYDEYGIEPYMTNDCYLYRESGIYYVNDIIKTRRKMLNKTQEELCNNDISISTVQRIENSSKGTYKSKILNILDQLSLYPNCINTGIASNEKETINISEELRFAIVSFRYKDAEDLIIELKKHLNMEIDINKQNIYAQEYLINYRQCKLSTEKYIDKLKECLEITVKLDTIFDKEKLFLTTEELVILASISTAYKEIKEYEEAYKYILPIVKYIKNIEEEGLVDGRIGLYEMLMECVSSLYGDMGMYDESNDISHKLIRISLKLRRSGQIHPSIYNFAWNKNESKQVDFDYNEEINKCILFSQLNFDMADVEFYREQLKV